MSNREIKSNEKIRTHKAQVKIGVSRSFDIPKSAWVYPEIGVYSSRPPSAMTLTTVDQSRQLEQIHDLEVAHTAGVTSVDWLQNHSLCSLDLTLQDILKQGIPLRPQISSGASRPTLHLKYYLSKLLEYKSKLIRFIQICDERIKWLLKDSRRAFGLVKARQPCILLDTSDTNCGFGRLQLLQESLKQLLNEQLSKVDKLYIASFGTYLEPLWNTPRDVNSRILSEAEFWVTTLQPSGSCNVLGAVQQLIKWQMFDAFVLIVGNCPNQPPELIIDYIREAICGKSIPFHTVAYNCSISSTNMFLRDLAELTGGQYHCYSATNESQIFTGSDLQLLNSEMERAKDILGQVIEMIENHHIGEIKITVIDQFVNSLARCTTIPVKINECLSNVTATTCHPQPSLEIVEPVTHKEIAVLSDDLAVLSVKSSPFPIGTSADWLKENSLRAKGLTLYQVIAPNTYSYVNGYIPSINRKVKSQVHHKCMVQFEWHDGSTKNVHVDPVLLFEYQHALQNIIHLYRRRIEWLMTGSKKIFGTIIEERVIIIIDLSYTMAGEILQLQKFVKGLLEEQLHDKISFNIICVGGSTVYFKPAMVEPTQQTLKEAWRWFLNQACSGSRKFLDAFRIATENDEERQHNIDVAGLYFITSGIPDEPKSIACSYVEESFVGRPCNLHCIYLEPVDNDPRTIVGQYADSDTTVAYLRELTASGRGRFHWLKENVVVESEDIRNIICEMEKAHNYTKKAAMLVDSVKRKEEETDMTNEPGSQLVPRPPTDSKGKLKAVRQTQLSQARLNGARPHSASTVQASKKVERKERPHSSKHSDSGSNRSLAWKPNNLTSSSNLIPPAHGSDLDKKGKEHTVKPVERVFYTELGNQTGSIFESLQSSNPGKRKSFGDCEIPDKEESCTSKEWMQSYSLSRMRLDINSVVEMSPCSHGDKKTQSTEWRHCTIFPTVNLKGFPKHIHMKSRELADYEDYLEKILARYTRRLHWLLSGSRKVFGVVVEKTVVIVIDTSGSMVSFLDELKSELKCLIKEQIQRQNIRFNVLKFSSSVDCWNSKLVRLTEQNYQDFVEWVSNLEAYGGTNTLEALQAAFDFDDVDGIYFLTDGKPDQSTTSVLREAANLSASRRVRIHTISFNCKDGSANNFLRLLAAQSGGRYHCYQDKSEVQDLDQQQVISSSSEIQAVNLPNLEGDDVKRVCKEISLCRKYLKKVKIIRNAVDQSDYNAHLDAAKDEIVVR